MIATINLSVDVPHTYDLGLLKQQLIEYARQLIGNDSLNENSPKYYTKEDESPVGILQEPSFEQPYTMEEINARIDQSERDSAEGKVYDFDDVMREIEEEFAFEEKLEMAEAV